MLLSAKLGIEVAARQLKQWICRVFLNERAENAAVEIRDSRGTPVLQTRTDGPFLLVRLPSGSYNVDVEWNGAHKRKTIEVGTERREHVMIEFAGALDYR